MDNGIELGQWLPQFLLWYEEEMWCDSESQSRISISQINYFLMFASIVIVIIHWGGQD